MTIDVKYIGDDLHLAVMDENVTDSDTVGDATIKLSSLCIGTGLDEWFEIQYKGKKAGVIHLKSTWKPTGSALVDKPKAEAVARPALLFTSGQVAKPVQYVPMAVMQQSPAMYQQQMMI